MRLAETRYAPDGRLRPHAHGSPHLCLVLAGGYEEEVGRTRLDCGPLTLLYHAAGAVHANRFAAGGARCLNVEMDPLALGVDRLLARLGGSSVVQRGTPTPAALRLARELDLRDDLSPLATETLVSEIVSELAREPRLALRSEPPAWLLRVHERLREEFARSLDLARLAEEVGVHRTHLARAFRQHFGCTMGQFVRQRRVELASAELRRSDRPLASVAYAAGFADQSHMTRVFKRFVGTTPGRYRRLTRG